MVRILVIDASPLIYATYSKVGHLSTPDGTPTGLRYGFIRSVNSYRKKTKADQVVLAFDSSGPVLKAEGREEYKSDREFTSDKAKMYSQVPDLREMLSLTAWTQIDAPGYEADDIIGAIARAKAPKGDEVIIVSADNDMAQLVGHNVKIFEPGKKGARDSWKTDEVIHGYFGVWPEHLLVYRALVGDKSDNLDGVNLTPANEEAIKDLLNKTPRGLSVEEIIDELYTKLPEEVASFLKEDSVDDRFKSNLKIMSLNRPPKMNITKGRKDPVALEELFESLVFKSLMKSIPEYTNT